MLELMMMAMMVRVVVIIGDEKNYYKELICMFALLAMFVLTWLLLLSLLLLFLKKRYTIYRSNYTFLLLLLLLMLFATLTTALTAETTKPRKPNEDIRFSATHSVSVSWGHWDGNDHVFFQITMVIVKVISNASIILPWWGSWLWSLSLSLLADGKVFDWIMNCDGPNLRNKDNGHLTEVSFISQHRLGGEVEHLQSWSKILMIQR